MILGVNEPQYTEGELEDLRQENETGVMYEGRHYTTYEATQRQRKLERAARDRKRRILIDEALGDEEKLQTDRIRLVRLKDEYARFSKETGLPMQHARMETAGFTWKHGKAAERAAKTAEKVAKVAQEKEKLLKSIKEHGIIHKADVPLEQRGYTAEQYQDMLAKRTKIYLGGDINSLELEGTPNSITDLVREDGRVKQRRVYGPAGKAVIDYDTDDHGKPKAHPTGAHKHLFNYSNKKPRGNPSELTDGDLELNGDIIKEGDNYHAPKAEGAD